MQGGGSASVLVVLACMAMLAACRPLAPEFLVLDKFLRPRHVQPISEYIEFPSQCTAAFIGFQQCAAEIYQSLKPSAKPVSHKCCEVVSEAHKNCQVALPMAVRSKVDFWLNRHCSQPASLPRAEGGGSAPATLTLVHRDGPPPEDAGFASAQSNGFDQPREDGFDPDDPDAD